MSDLIRRKEATTIPVMPVEHREYQTMNLDDAYELGWFDCQKCIEELPSAPLYTPDELQTMQDLEWAQLEKMYELGKEERKKGKWIPHEGGKFVGFPCMHYECSECRAFEPTETNFCPNCGADMREGEQSEID